MKALTQAVSQGNALLQGRSPRERVLVYVCVVAWGIGLLYWLVWQPASRYAREAVREYYRTQAQLARLDQYAQTWGTQAKDTVTEDSPLATIVSETARTRAIPLNRVEAADDGSVFAAVDGAAFEKLVEWIYALEGRYRIRVVQFDADRLNDTAVAVRIRFEKR